mmetsp:Transcript_28549/g.32658  ORF Transcript_28549/g.32658 Transcript_28549/m.32658 type:complete len:113 (-) Transcript_28549:234-572(-)
MATSGELTFSTLRKEVNTIAQATLKKHLEAREYDAKEVREWCNRISEDIVQDLQKKNNNFKYCVTCTIMQKNDGGLHLSSSCFWDSSTDGSCTLKWDHDTMYCIVNVFGFAL